MSDSPREVTVETRDSVSNLPKQVPAENSRSLIELLEGSLQNPAITSLARDAALLRDELGSVDEITPEERQRIYLQARTICSYVEDHGSLSENGAHMLENLETIYGDAGKTTELTHRLACRLDNILTEERSRSAEQISTDIAVLLTDPRASSLKYYDPKKLN